jgi:endoglucanase
MKLLNKYMLLISVVFMSCASGTQEIELSIRYNQIGYTANRPKLISVVSNNEFDKVSYIIKDASGKEIMSGETGKGLLWKDSGEYVSILDVSSINNEGEYEVLIGENKVRYKLLNNPYGDLSQALFKYYYLNRCSIELEEKYAGQWKRPAGLNDDIVKIHSSAATKERPEGTVISGSKGWFDAGDYNKYVSNSGISTYTLLSAFENYSEYYGSKEFNIPESGNNLPDVLDEVIWNLDWMLSMQDPFDGGVYHKLTGLKFSGAIMPHEYDLERYVVKKSTSAALNLAAVAAIASRVFSQFEAKKDYSVKLLKASKKAYEWAKKHPEDYFRNPEGVRTGQYEDDDLFGEFQWAAVELLITTKDESYSKDIQIDKISNEVPWWQDASALSLYSITKHSTSLDKFIDVNLAKKKFLDQASELKNRIETEPMRVAMKGKDYVWGSNGVAGNQLMYLMKAYEVTNDIDYLNAVFVGLDYFLGRNGVGTTYITGQGIISPKFPHHRTSEADKIKEPVPGMVVGGPQPGQQDKCEYFSKMPAKSYSDTWCSYASNEVTINWNAPLVYVVNALQYYQTKNFK